MQTARTFFSIFIITFFSTLTLAEDKIYSPVFFDMQEYKDQTYLNFMKTTVKPATDKLATNGYPMCGSKEVEDAYRLVDKKVRGKIKDWGGLEEVKKIADTIRKQKTGENVSLETLPFEIQKVRPNLKGKLSFNMSTFFGLACGGGATIQFYKDNLGYNVHYKKGGEKADRSGRSFGAGPTRLANDASDREYLTDLQDYVTRSEKNTPEFYRTLFGALLNTDGSNYPKIARAGQTLLSDFLSVFTAEQIRNLMDGRITPHWDAALLEVTLLAAFHAGQDEIRLFYYDRKTGKTSFTNKTYKQVSCTPPTSPKFPKTFKTAQLIDYWQYSRRADNEENCSRSGINVTNDEFRLLGGKITSYLRNKNKELYREVLSAIGEENSQNLFYELSKYLINKDTPKEIDADDVK